MFILAYNHQVVWLSLFVVLILFLKVFDFTRNKIPVVRSRDELSQTKRKRATFILNY